MVAADRVYSSPLQRCLVTAEALFPLQKVHADDRLLERDLGDWAAQSKESLRQLVPEAFLEGGRLSPYYTPRGGEPLGGFCERVAAFIQTVYRSDEPVATVVAVTHNGVIRLMRHLLDGLPLDETFAEGEPHLIARTFVLDAPRMQLMERQIANLSNHEVDPPT